MIHTVPFPHRKKGTVLVVLLILSVTATRRVHRSGGPRLAPQTPQGGEGDDYGQC